MGVDRWVLSLLALRTNNWWNVIAEVIVSVVGEQGVLWVISYVLGVSRSCHPMELSGSREFFEWSVTFLGWAGVVVLCTMPIDNHAALYIHPTLELNRIYGIGHCTTNILGLSHLSLVFVKYKVNKGNKLASYSNSEYRCKEYKVTTSF